MSIRTIETPYGFSWELLQRNRRIMTAEHMYATRREARDAAMIILQLLG